MTQHRSSSDSAGSQVNRRTYLKSSLVALGAAGGVAAESRGVTADSNGKSRSSYKIMEGTPEETTVYKIDSGNPGPTVMLTGGIHGSEANGYKSAEIIMNWDIDAGRMVVIPRCNQWGIERDSRTYDNGNESDIDLNRQFPPGATPTTPLARAIWQVAVSEDIDFLIDMHSSHGIYKQGDGVGQGIFSTEAGDATAYRKRLVSYMNENVVSDSTFTYSGATSHDGSRPMLKHKVGADLDTPAMIIESTYEYDRSIAKQVQNTTAAVREFFREYGLIAQSNKSATDNSLLHHDDTAAVNASVDDNGKRSALKFTVTNDADSSMWIQDVRIEPENSDIDGLRDHSYDEGKWVSELFINADVQNGLTDINGGTSLPTTIDLDTDGFSESASTEAVLSSGSSATVHLYQFESNGSPVDMAGESVTFTVDYELEDGTSKTLSFASDSSGSLAPSHPLGFDGHVVAVDTPEDSNGERSGLSFEVTNDASSNLIIETLRITPSDGDIDELRDHSYDEGKWVSELFIDADVQHGVTDINDGMALPGSIDLDADGYSDGTSTQAVLSSGSSATVNLYQFRASGSPVDMAGKTVTVGVEYSVNGSNKTRTITLSP